MPIIYNREQGYKAIKNMRQTSKKAQTAIDKSTDLVYNTGMTNNNTSTKENEMIQSTTYQGNLVNVIKINTYWNEALVSYVQPVGKQQKNAFKIGLPFLKKLEINLSK